MLRRTASAGDSEHLHFLPDAAASSTVMSEWGAGMGRPHRQLRPESSKPFGFLEVSTTFAELPCCCTGRAGWHQRPFTSHAGRQNHHAWS